MPLFKDSFVILAFYSTALIPKYHPKPDIIFFLSSLPLLKLFTMETSGKLQNINKLYYINFCEPIHSCGITNTSETANFQHTLFLPEQIKEALTQKQSSAS